jgi:hypothetical protein
MKMTVEPAAQVFSAIAGAIDALEGRLFIVLANPAIDPETKADAVREFDRQRRRMQRAYDAVRDALETELPR